MTQRERRLALILAAALGAGGIFFGIQMVMRYGDYGKTIETLEGDIERTSVEVRKTEEDRRQLSRWRLMSLPTDVALAKGEYYDYLRELLTSNLFEELSLNPLEASRAATTQGSKKPVYTPVDFNIQARV